MVGRAPTASFFLRDLRAGENLGVEAEEDKWREWNAFGGELR